MKRTTVPLAGLAAMLLAAALLAGCSQGPLKPIAVAPVAGQPIRFDDLAAVLAAAVDEHGRVDPTALAVHLSRLEHQLALLAQPWPSQVATPGRRSDDRLAWLYNARAGWSLRIVAEALSPAPHRPGYFRLPARIDARRLLDTPFVLNGRTTTLAAIDAELAQWDDFRLAAAAPGATDWFGPLPAKPFTAKDVRASLAQRFERYVLSPDRLVIDHADERLEVPPALWQFAPRLERQYDQRYDTRDATLVTTLGAMLPTEARHRLGRALGYVAQPRQRWAGIEQVKPSHWP